MSAYYKTGRPKLLTGQFQHTYCSVEQEMVNDKPFLVQHYNICTPDAAFRADEGSRDVRDTKLARCAGSELSLRGMLSEVGALSKGAAMH